MADVYEGGVPASAGKTLFPSVKNEADETESYGGEGGIKTTRGGATEMNPNKGGKDFLDESGYDTGSMEVGRPSSMKVVNPDDIKH